MIREELESGRLDVRFESMQLDTIAIVDEDVFFLRDCEKGLVL